MWENWHLLWNLEVVIWEIFLVCCMKLLSSVKIVFFLIEMTSFICHIVHCKDGPYPSSMQGNKIHNAQVLLTAKPGPLPAPSACILGEFCETALMSWSPSDRMVRSELVFSPFCAEPRHPGWSIPVPEEVALQPSRRWDLCWPWEPSALPAAPEHSRAFNTLSSASWQILNEEISLQMALVSENLFRASGGSCH